MDNFSTLAGLASIAGLGASIYAAIKARSASKAASEARDASLVHSLADDLDLASHRAEQLFDFLQHARYNEANLRVNELTSSLSELPHRRNQYLSTVNKNKLLTSRFQLQTISEAIHKSSASNASLDKEQVMIVARRVYMSVREVLGDVKSYIEQGELQ
jgi:ATP phosphoribosyltransferase regulatory subunit HisZ